MSSICGAVQPDAGAWAGAYSLAKSCSSPAMARMLVRQALAECPREMIETAELLVSELVTNAVQHAETALVLDVQPARNGFRVIVQDSSPERPVPAEALVTEATSGRGLLLVDTLATAWGWETVPTGKQVWFELQ